MPKERNVAVNEPNAPRILGEEHSLTCFRQVDLD